MFQLTRGLPALLMLVRGAFEGRDTVVRTAARDLATDVLRAARDRSRDAHPRPLLHLQARTEPLTRPRRRARKKAATARSRATAPM